jgi:hypothetical protein
LVPAKGDLSGLSHSHDATPLTPYPPKSTQILMLIITRSSPQPVKAKNPASRSSIQHFPFSHDPYVNLPVLGMGMTGIIYELGEDRVVKKARKSQLSDAGNAEYMNKINQQTLENESQVFKRLGSCEGIIHYFQISQYGIELARAQDDLESYMKTHPEPEIALKSNGF